MKMRLNFCWCIILLAVIWKADSIAVRAGRAKHLLCAEYGIWQAHRHKASLSGLQPLTTQGNEWFAKYHFISHSGGIVHGRLQTNSREAWELSYRRGNRVIDADYEFTADNHGVLRHGWTQKLEQGSEPRAMTLQDFTNTPIKYKYHSMAVEDVITFMLSHKDLYVAVDSKQTPAKTYTSIVKTARDMNAAETLDRIIVSLYRPEDISVVRNIYPFRSFVLRQYGWVHNWYRLAEFCLKNDIHAVNVSSEVIDADPEGVKLLISKGIHVYAAVVNSLEQMQHYKDLGITGAVSDYLSESDWGLLR